MKLNTKLTTIFLIIFMSSFAYAHDGEDHGSDHSQHHGEWTVEELSDATKLAFADLKILDPEVAERVIGISAFKSQEGARVRLIANRLDHGTMRINFICHKHDEEMECHLQ